MRTVRLSPILLIFSFFIFTSGCSSTKFMVNSMEPLMEKMNTAVNKHTDVELVKAAMPAALIQLDGMIEASPGNEKILVRTAEAYNGYTFVFVEGLDNDRARIDFRCHKMHGGAMLFDTRFDCPFMGIQTGKFG